MWAKAGASYPRMHLKEENKVFIFTHRAKIDYNSIQLHYKNVYNHFPRIRKILHQNLKAFEVLSAQARFLKSAKHKR